MAPSQASKASPEKQRAFQRVSRMGRKRLLRVGELLLWIMALLLPACGGFYHYAYYQHFRQGTCTILD
ncbi:MAG: hypothetical protein ACRDHZ_14320, partial [Ktedonobacteraceae bacterium]